MAGEASSSTTSSSFSTSVFDHDAFLSFRGADTRYGFTGNLYSALIDRGIDTFIDDVQLPKGNEIRPTLLRKIERSRTAIVVLSKDYASSSFCLDELVKIMKSVHGQGRLVIPIFYQVAPTDVRHLTKTYGDALNDHENKLKAKKDKLDENMERLERWKMALKQVADLSGHHFEHGGDYEYEFIPKIVEQVSRVIRPRPLPTADHPVGLNIPVNTVTELLDLGSDDIRMVGIHGIGGVGKTTLAAAVYNKIADSVEHLSFRLCFMGDVRENSERHGLQHLQKIVLSELFGEKREVTCVKHGISILKQKLEGKKILLFLDDVDQEEQLKALAGESNWFGRGSRVIVTTRDINLLSRYEDKKTYELQTLNEKDALKLLSLKAFKTNQVDSSYMDILNEVATYASGLPLALEVIGSSLIGKSIEQWKSALCQYKKIPKKEIQSILMVSFDALEETEKEIFLDIACCLKGYHLKDVKEILCAHRRVDSLDYALRVLVEKSLIKTYGYWVTLHDLVQHMGREIVRLESPKNPGEHSRLWHLEDIVQVFERNEGTNKIEMIHMDFPMFEKVIDWDGEAFKKMTNIKTLIIERACFSQGPKLLPNSLRVLKWQRYPSHSLPIGFHSEELVIFQLNNSSFMSVEFLHKQKFKSLTVINFDHSDIEEIPDVSGIPNLKELSFMYCKNLIKVDESVGFLNGLKLLNAWGCESLRSFPPIKLTNLEHLRLRLCLSLENFPEILGKMENILEIDVFGTSIKELPSSIAYLPKVRKMTLGNSATSHLSISSIAMLPCLEELHFMVDNKRLQFPELDEEQRSSMLSSNAQVVTMWGCNVSDECWPLLVAWFRNVVELDLKGNNFTVLPKSIQELCSLRRLDLSNCKKLQEIRGIPPNMNDFYAVECISLTSSSKMKLLNEEFHKGGNKLVHLPGSTIPEWFEHNNIGSTIPEWWFEHNTTPGLFGNNNNTKISMEFWCRNKIPEICLCVLDDNYTGETISWDLEINGREISPGSFNYKSRDVSCTRAHVAIVGLKRMKFYHGHVDAFPSENKWNRVDHGMDKFLLENKWNHVYCCLGRRLEFNTGVCKRWKIGVHFINSMEDDIYFPNPWKAFEGFLWLPKNSSDFPPAENSMKDYVSNRAAQIEISSTTSSDQATQPVKITDLAADHQEKNWSDNSSANTSTQKQSVSASQKPSQSKENPEQGIPSEVIQEQSKEETLVQSPLEDADVFAIDDDDDDAEYRPAKRAQRADQEDTILPSDSTIAENKPTTSLINTEEVVGCDNNIQIKEQENLESDSDDDDVDLSFMDDIDEGLSDVLNKPNSSSTSVSDLRSINPSLEHPISTETHATETNPETPEIPLKQLYELLHILNEPVDSLAENDDLKQKLLNLIFDLNKKPLPSAVKPVIQTLENFIHGVFDTILEVKRIEKDKETFAATLCSLEKDLKKAQKGKNKIEAGLCKGKSVQLELEAQISDLMSKKKLVDSGIAKGEAELAKTNKKLASLTQDKEEKTKALSQASVQLERANTKKMKLLEDQNKLKLSIRSFLG